MEEVAQRLIALKKEIDSAKAERSELVGAEKHYMARLKEEFGVEDEKMGEKKRAELTKEVEDLEREIQAGFKKLEEEYEW